MTPLVRLYARSVAIGIVLAAVFTALLVGLDVAHLRHLVLEVRGGALAVVMLVVFNAIVFSGVQFGIAVMRMAESPKPPGRGRRSALPPVPVAAALPARRGR